MSIASIAFIVCFFTLIGAASIYVCKYVEGIKKEWVAPAYLLVMVMRFILSLAMVITFCWKIAENEQEGKVFALSSVGAYFIMLIVTTLLIRKILKFK